MCAPCQHHQRGESGVFKQDLIFQIPTVIQKIYVFLWFWLLILMAVTGREYMMPFFRCRTFSNTIQYSIVLQFSLSSKTKC